MGRLALIIGIALAAGCVHPNAPSPPSSHQHRTQWILSAEATGDEPFCVEWTQDSVAPGDDRALPCLTVAAIRRLVRAQLDADE